MRTYIYIYIYSIFRGIVPLKITPPLMYLFLLFVDFNMTNSVFLLTYKSLKRETIGIVE